MIISRATKLTLSPHEITNIDRIHQIITRTSSFIKHGVTDYIMSGINNNILANIE